MYMTLVMEIRAIGDAKKSKPLSYVLTSSNANIFSKCCR